jgi:hypothetical protein
MCRSPRSAVPRRSAAMFALAVDHHINRITLRIVHGSKVGVFGENDGHDTRVVGEVFLDRLIRFGGVDGKNDQALVGKFLRDVVDDLGLTFAVFAPRRPEFEQDDFAFHRVIVELIAGGGLYAKARSGLSAFIASERFQSERHQQGGEQAYGGKSLTP